MRATPTRCRPTTWSCGPIATRSRRAAVGGRAAGAAARTAGTASSKTSIDASLPDAIGEFVRWLIDDSGWHVTERDRRRRLGRSTASDVCLLFRRFVASRGRHAPLRRGARIARRAAPARRRQDVPRARGGGRAAHGARRHRVARTTSCRCSRRCAGRSSRLATKSCSRITRGRATASRPVRRPPEDAAGAPGAHRRGARRCCATCTRGATIGRSPTPSGGCIEATRAHAGFVLWRGGEQVLANVLHIAELARQYEVDGGVVVPRLRRELREARRTARRHRKRRSSRKAATACD